MRWGIRYQLLVPLLLVLLGDVGVSAWIAVRSVERARTEIEARVRNVAHLLSDAPQFPLASRVLEQMKQLSGADYLLRGDEGRVTTTLAQPPAQLPPEAAVRDDWQALRLGPPVLLDGQSYLCGGLRLRPPRTGETLYILYPETLWRDALWEALWPPVALGGFVGVAAVRLALVLGRRVVQRVRALERHTRLIAAGDFGPRPLPSPDDEIRDLARSVNEMAQQLARLQETVQRSERLRLLGQVGSGLAHQMRNGLTGARLAVQLHLQESSGQGDTTALQVALRQLSLLEAHLKRFLALGGDGSLRREPCPLGRLVGDALELVGPQCRHAGITVTWKPPAGDPVVEGDPGQLGQLVLNVLHNAVEAAGPGGTVEVGLVPGGGEADAPMVRLEVVDSGPGPPPELCDRLFEPFVTGKREGVGLGLPLARQIAESHGGRISWERAGRRTRFCIELPVAGRGLAAARDAAPAADLR